MARTQDILDHPVTRAVTGTALVSGVVIAVAVSLSALVAPLPVADIGDPVVVDESPGLPSDEEPVEGWPAPTITDDVGDPTTPAAEGTTDEATSTPDEPAEVEDEAADADLLDDTIGDVTDTIDDVVDDVTDTVDDLTDDAADEVTDQVDETADDATDSLDDTTDVLP